MATTPANPVNLQPMSLSELLDRTFTIYRRHFWFFCGVMLAPQAIALAFRLLLLLVAPVRMPLVMANPNDPFAALAAMKTTFISAFVLSIVLLICQGFALGAVSFGVSDFCLGRTSAVKTSYFLVFRRFFGYLGLMFLLASIGVAFLVMGFMAGGILGGIATALVSLIGALSPILKAVLAIAAVIFMLAAIAAGGLLALWLMARFAVSVPVFLLENRTALDSLHRSGELTAGHRGRILAAIVVMGVICYAVQLLLGGPFALFLLMSSIKGVVPLWTQIGGALAETAATILAWPLPMITITLIYYDVRIRKEAFDLETMMANLEPVVPGATGPVPDFR